jgi:hypothetical protein
MDYESFGSGNKPLNLHADSSLTHIHAERIRLNKTPYEASVFLAVLAMC